MAKGSLGPQITTYLLKRSLSSLSEGSVQLMIVVGRDRRGHMDLKESEQEKTDNGSQRENAVPEAPMQTQVSPIRSPEATGLRVFQTVF